MARGGKERGDGGGAGKNKDGDGGIPPLLAAASNPLMCSARIPDGPSDLFRRSFFTASSTSSSVGTESSMLVGSYQPAN